MKQRSSNTPVAKAHIARLVSEQGQSQILAELFSLVLSQGPALVSLHPVFHSQSWHSGVVFLNLSEVQSGSCLATLAQWHNDARIGSTCQMAWAVRKHSQLKEGFECGPPVLQVIFSPSLSLAFKWNDNQHCKTWVSQRTRGTAP